MKCPVCKSHMHKGLDLHSEQFVEDIVECSVCGTVWSVNHGMTEIVQDAQEGSFLAAISERVEADDYNLAI
jgi:uncharacterized Zn finger protein